MIHRHAAGQPRAREGGRDIVLDDVKRERYRRCQRARQDSGSVPCAVDEEDDGVGPRSPLHGEGTQAGLNAFSLVLGRDRDDDGTAGRIPWRTESHALEPGCIRDATPW